MSLRIRCLLRTRSFLRRGFCLLALTGSSIYLIFAQTAPNADEPDTCAADGSRTADWRTLIPNTLHDQKRIFATFPNQVIHGKHWIPILAVAAAATGLIVVDQYDTPYFRRTKTLKTFNSVFSSANTATGIVLMPVAFYSAGYFLKSGYMKETAVLAAESAIDGEIVDTVFKLVSDRQRPSAIPKTGNFADSFVEGKSHINGSFPSGHAVAAFSVATVISRRYGHVHKWVPVVAYGLSAAIGFSRISSSQHFPADVFLGAAVGYGIGRFAVLHQ